MICSSCETNLSNSKIKYYRIEAEIGTYFTCAPCVTRAIRKIKKMKNRSRELEDLLKQLKKMTIVN